MTWTTLGPGGVTVPVVGALMVLTLIALVYALGLLYRVLKMRRAKSEDEEWEVYEP